jgi:hypothetical protein
MLSCTVQVPQNWRDQGEAGVALLYVTLFLLVHPVYVFSPSFFFVYDVLYKCLKIESRLSFKCRHVTSFTRVCLHNCMVMRVLLSDFL